MKTTVERTQRHVEITGRADEVMANLDYQQPELSFLATGIAVTLHALNADAVTIDLSNTGGIDGVDSRPISVAYDGETEHLTVKFLPVEEVGAKAV